MLTRLAHLIVRHRWAVIGAWLVLTLVGGFAAAKVSTRWYQSFSIPGKPAYEASQRTLKAFRLTLLAMHHGPGGDGSSGSTIAHSSSGPAPRQESSS